MSRNNGRSGAKDAVKEAEGLPEGLEFDHSRISHRDSRHADMLALKMQRAQRDLDENAFDEAYGEFDQFIMNITVSVPDGWLPDGVSLDDDDWIGDLSQANYQILLQHSTPQPGKKGA